MAQCHGPVPFHLAEGQDAAWLSGFFGCQHGHVDLDLFLVPRIVDSGWGDADHGLASLYDVAGLAMMWSVLNAWLQGTALLRTAGVDAATYAPFAQQIAVGVAEWLPGYAEQIDSGSFPAEVSALETDAQAMAHLIEESETLGVSAELPKLIKAMADRSIAAGHGAEQYPVLIEEFSTRRDA